MSVLIVHSPICCKIWFIFVQNICSMSFTNLCFSFSLRPINLHQRSPLKYAEICLSLVLGRFWPCLPRKSSHLFSLLLSQPTHSFTSFSPLIRISFQFRGGSFSTQYFPLPSPIPFPPQSSPSSTSLSHLREGLLSLYQSKNSWNLHNPPHHPLVFPTYEKAFFLSIYPKTVEIVTAQPQPQPNSISTRVGEDKVISWTTTHTTHHLNL